MSVLYELSRTLKSNGDKDLSEALNSKINAKIDAIMAQYGNQFEEEPMDSLDAE